MSSFTLLFIVVFVTLAFEFSNGWHDAANSIATVVSTRVLTPFRAVVWAAFFNFVAAFVFGTAVASTIGKGMVHIELVNQQVLLAGLFGAISWNTITLILGLPARVCAGRRYRADGAPPTCSARGNQIAWRHL